MRNRKSPFTVFLCCTLAVPTCGVLVGDLNIDQAMELELLIEILRPWLAVGALLGLAHILLRPVLRMLSAPLGCLTLGFFGFVIDVGMIYACAYLVDGFQISGLLYAVLTAILINVISAVVGRS